jgi:hypothetical protein
MSSRLHVVYSLHEQGHPHRGGRRDAREWKLVPVRANRMPAAASYLKAPGDDTFRAFKFDVIRVRDGRIAEITTFDNHLFGQFGLAETL